MSLFICVRSIYDVKEGQIVKGGPALLDDNVQVAHHPQTIRFTSQRVQRKVFNLEAGGVVGVAAAAMQAPAAPRTGVRRRRHFPVVEEFDFKLLQRVLHIRQVPLLPPQLTLQRHFPRYLFSGKQIRRFAIVYVNRPVWRHPSRVRQGTNSAPPQQLDEQ